MNRTLAYILKHLMTTAPILVGILVVIFATCTYTYSWVGMAHLIVQYILGFGLATLGWIILDYFNN